MEMSPAQPPFSFFAEELAHVLGKAGHDCAYTKTHGLLLAIQKSGLHACMLVSKFVRGATCASVLRVQHIWII